jgi:hypothetical protein
VSYPRCPDCPVSGTCVVAWSDHRPFCDWAASGDPARRARIVELSAPVRQEGQFPPVLTQMANFIGSLATHALGGFPEASREEQLRRLAICRDCDRFDHDSVRCRECGCLVVTIAAWADKGCPIGKWGPTVVEGQRQSLPCGSCGGQS